MIKKGTCTLIYGKQHITDWITKKEWMAWCSEGLILKIGNKKVEFDFIGESPTYVMLRYKKRTSKAFFKDVKIK